MTLVACNLALLLVLLSMGRSEPQGIAAARLISIDPARSFRPPSADAPSAPGSIAVKALFRSPRPLMEVMPNDQPPPPAPRPSFRLVGVVWGETERFAIIQSAQNGPIRRVRVGETVERWHLENLTARVATFRMDELSLPLDLQRTRPPASELAPNGYGRLGRR